MNWRGVLLQSGLFLGIEHGFRFATEADTRQQLRGPFVRDYFRSLKGSGHHWGDTDPFLVNYVGHPLQGSVTGFIWTQNHPTESRIEFSNTPAYWRSRLKAMGWSAVYSTQFELGPVSEASLGNLGSPMVPRTAGLVDLVVTPLGGFGFQVAEDVLDRFAVRWVEKRLPNRGAIIVARGVLNPARTFANCLRFRVPWHRDSRPGVNAITERQ
ncbi:MAG: hypothetical protein K2X03_29525 [Bryobacteraceae bacterium]|nr:hypothetical protein [Bryobacteraceae bacterium]